MKYLPFLLLVALIACKKDRKPDSIPDKIVYTDIKDDTLKNVSGRDTVIGRVLDVNSDQIADLSISLNTYLCPYQGTPSGGPCTAHFTKVVISGGNINKTCCISSSNGTPQIKFFSKGQELSQSSGNYQTSLNYLYSNDGRWFYYDFSGEAYIGFCLQNNCYGWIRFEGFGAGSSTVIIKEYAVNMTAGNPIITGQIE